MEKNGKNVPFFSKERKITARTEHSFQKNGKEKQEWNVIFKRMEKNGRTERSFQKNRCPTLS